MRLEDRLLHSLETISLLLVPAAMLYTLNVYLHAGEYFDLSFGPVTYMTVAYTLLPLFAAIVIRLEKVPASTANVGKILLALFFWYVMLLTTTRTRSVRHFRSSSKRIRRSSWIAIRRRDNS